MDFYPILVIIILMSVIVIFSILGQGLTIGRMAGISPK